MSLETIPEQVAQASRLSETLHGRDAQAIDDQFQDGFFVREALFSVVAPRMSDGLPHDPINGLSLELLKQSRPFVLGDLAKKNAFLAALRIQQNAAMKPHGWALNRQKDPFHEPVL